ncbi:porin [Paraburkholderia terrae]|uniref:porin n=1 Tax=Paraburkholderia terrae TaxID=311230 RepID=UPI0033655AC6
MCSSRRSMMGAMLFLAASGAAAETGVTLYGVVDVFGQYLNNGGKGSWSERSGGNSGSYFGLKGTEDLGGGLKAVFNVENGYNVNNGAFFGDSTAMFYRQAWVSLAHEKYGSITFGRQYQPTFWALYPSDPFRANEVLSPLAAAATTVDRNTLAVQSAGGRSSNAVIYKSPNVGGAQFWGMYALAASVTQPLPLSTGNMLDLAATYSGHGLYVGLAYQNQHPGSKTVPGLPAMLPSLSTEHFTSALSYRVGIVNLQFNYGYHRPKSAAAGSLAARLNAAHSFSISELGATIQATPADALEIAGFQRVVRGAHDNTWGVQIGADHSLSKRTALYARGGYMRNNGTATMSWPGVAVSSPGTSQTLAVAGMTHRF